MGFIYEKRTLDDIREFSNRFLGKASEATTGLQLRVPAYLGSRQLLPGQFSFRLLHMLPGAQQETTDRY